MNEFDLIAQYFEPLTLGRREAGGLRDDAAVLKIPEGRELVVTSDTLNEGVHFLPKEKKPEHIARKALRVNLSDLAAMGAEPYCYQLNLALPEEPEAAWLEAFTSALAEDQKAYGIFLSGGDTTGTKGPLSVSITAMGLVPEGRAVRRSGAKAGDYIVLTGPVGDAFLGLQVLCGEIDLKDPEYVIERYRFPNPRTALAEALRLYAHAAVDVSDGLAADLGHICAASGLGAKVELGKIPFSDAAQKLLKEEVVTYEDLLTGGDDYEVLLAVPPDDFQAFLEAAVAKQGVTPQVIGSFEDGQGVSVLDAKGRALSFERTGWRHF